MWTRAVWGAAVVTTTAIAGGAASQELPRPPAELERIGAVGRANGLPEVSGVAVSRRHPDILWMHNDSGDPELIAVRPSGEVVTRFALSGARLVDWEDIALGPCPERFDRHCLFIGDVGDNNERRTRGIVYILREPEPRPTGGGPHTLAVRAVRVRYVDGPHDVESLAVDPEGNLHLITKGRTRPILRYRIPREDLRRDSVAVEPVGSLPITPAWMLGRWVTGAAISADGGRAVVRTYTELYFFDRTPDDTWTLRPPVCWLGVAEPQGEAVDFLDRDTVVLVSESTPNADGTILRVRC